MNNNARAWEVNTNSKSIFALSVKRSSYRDFIQWSFAARSACPLHRHTHTHAYSSFKFRKGMFFFYTDVVHGNIRPVLLYPLKRIEFSSCPLKWKMDRHMPSKDKLWQKSLWLHGRLESLASAWSPWYFCSRSCSGAMGCFMLLSTSSSKHNLAWCQGLGHKAGWIKGLSYYVSYDRITSWVPQRSPRDTGAVCTHKHRYTIVCYIST